MASTTYQHHRIPPPQHPVTIIDYIWLHEDSAPLHGRGELLFKQKTRIINAPVQNDDDIPCWVVDGEATHQQPSRETEVLLRPVLICPDPFRCRDYGVRHPWPRAIDEGQGQGQGQAMAHARASEQSGDSAAAAGQVPGQSSSHAAAGGDSNGSDMGRGQPSRAQWSATTAAQTATAGAQPLVTCLLVLCEVLKLDGTPVASNSRHEASRLFHSPHVTAVEAWFGLEQEYQLLEGTSDMGRPLGWPASGDPESTHSNAHYCGIGPHVTRGRRIMESHLAACNSAGIDVVTMNAEVQQGMLEFALAPKQGLAAADALWMARYILCRVAEEDGLSVSFSAKPVPHGHGAGLHVNVSTADTRADNGGYEAIMKIVKNLQARHINDLPFLGGGNEARLVGNEECASIACFSYGIGTRQPHVRIPRDTERRRKGYFEDRRPAANADPYLATSRIIASALGMGKL